MRSFRLNAAYVVAAALAVLLLLFVPMCDALLADKILVVGATGGTGLRAIQGLLDVGWKPRQIRLVTRNASKPNLIQLKQTMGFVVFQANLDVPKTLERISKGCSGCYIHSTSSDTPELDTKEVERARNLCAALVEQASVRHVVYNSAAARPNHGVKRIEQKHCVEKIFQEAPSLSFTSLRANLFMEELWKGYTRPQILKGSYPLPVHRKKRLFLTSVRDVGKIAGRLLQQQPESRNSKSVINVASDCLTGPHIAEAFATAQETPCRYMRPRLMEWKARWRFPELNEQIRFLQSDTEMTDISGLKDRFPHLLTSFHDFLKDRNRTYATFSDASTLET